MEEKIIMPLSYKEPDRQMLDMMDFIAKASEAVSALCLIDVPRNISIESRTHSSFFKLGKVTIKPKIDWLALNREMHGGSY